MTTKRCSLCKLHKATGDFYKSRTKKDGFHSWCKDCKRTKEAASYDPLVIRGYALKKNYGLSLERYDAMLEMQDGTCAICREPPPSGEYLFVDHNHATRVVRALLCKHCNYTLGHARESVHILHRCADYLIAHSEEA